MVLRGRYSPVGVKVLKGANQGVLLFWDDTLQAWVPTETTELFWDDTNKRFGIKTATPSSELDINGTGTFGNLIIADDGFIGSVSDTDAIQIEADGDVVMSQDLTVDGTISDGTATLTGGNYSSAGTITSGNITILSPAPILVFQDSNSLGAASVGFIEWRDSGGGRAGFLGNNSSGNDDLFWKNEQGGNIGIQTTGAGKVQIFSNTVVAGTLTVPNSGIHILDTGADHALILASGEDLSADKTLTITLSDADRAVTFAGDSTINAGTHLDHALNQDANLVVWLRMDDVTAGDPDDLGSVGNTWTAEGNAAQTDAGVIGKAFTFDGTGDFLDVSSPTGLPTGTTARTTAFWVRTSSTAVQNTMLCYGGTTAGTKWCIATSGASSHLFLLVVAGNLQGTVIINDGKWHHITVSYDPVRGNNVTDVLIYVDGESDAISGSGSEVLQTSQDNLEVGIETDGASFPFDGEMDDVRIYDRELSANEIKELYQLGTLDAMTAFDAAYYKEYVASRAAYFNNLHVSGVANDLTMTGLTVTGGRDIDINASDLIGTGDIIPEDDNVQNLGSIAKTWNNFFTKDITIDDSGRIQSPANVIHLTFDETNNFFEFFGGDVGIRTTTPNETLQVVGTVQFGEDVTNFSKFESDGTLEFNGNATVFRDINIGTATLSGPPGLQPGIANFVDNLGADTGIATSGIAVGEGFSGEFEMQHDYKEGSDITFHIHFQGIAAPTGTDKVQFQLTFTVGHTDTTLAPVTIITVEVDFDTQYEFKLVSFAPISGTGIHIEDQFVFTLQRIAASADEYGGEALTATVGIHYEVDTVGSRQILVK